MTDSIEPPPGAIGRASTGVGAVRQFSGMKLMYSRAEISAASSSLTRMSPQPLTLQCMRAPPISSRVTFSPTTTSAIRGEPRYIDAFPSTMITASQNAGM